MTTKDTNSENSNSGNWNPGNFNSGDYNSGNGYRNFFCTDQKWFLFGEEVSEDVIEKIYQISMDWFSLEDKGYKEAWTDCPDEVLEEFSKIPEFQTEEARKQFFEITGRCLPSKEEIVSNEAPEAWRKLNTAERRVVTKYLFNRLAEND